MYNIVICDDDLNFIQFIKERILNSGMDDNEVTFFEYTSGNDFILNFEKLPYISLLILDIQIPDMDGNEIAQHFRQHFPTSMLVFCSGVYLPTVKSFEPNPFRYLLKEYSNQRLEDELRVIISELKANHAVPYIIGKRHNNIVKLEPDEIMYISVARKKSHIHINPKSKVYDFEDNIMCDYKMADLYKDLKNHNFVYAHNSYIVNLKYIKRITNVELELTNGELLSIARSKMPNLRESFVKYLSKKY